MLILEDAHYVLAHLVILDSDAFWAGLSFYYQQQHTVAKNEYTHTMLILHDVLDSDPDVDIASQAERLCKHIML